MQKWYLSSCILLTLCVTATALEQTLNKSLPQVHITKKPLQIIIEGNIGAGKTTFINLLAKKFEDTIVLTEPVEAWQDVNGHNLLQYLYDDPERWGYTFQTYAFVTHIKNQECAAKKNVSIVLLERSIYSCFFCFARNFMESNHMTLLEWELCKKLFEKHVTTAPKPDGFIYLKTSPEICFSRLTKRNRREESSVPLEYLENLSFNHDDWLIRKNGITPKEYTNIPVLLLDRNLDIFDPAVFDTYVQQVKDFIHELVSHS